MIELTDIGKSYGENKVLHMFSCSITENTVTCVMGPSGGGKTTLLRIMMGLEQPDSGYVSGLSHLKKSAVFQEDRLCENLSASSNIRLVCNKSIKPDSILEAMSAVGLSEDCAKQPVREMSGGQKRRVAIIRALMAEYDILFLDEPFKGLDEETKKRVISYVKEKTKGKTVILITHDLEECKELASSVINILK